LKELQNNCIWSTPNQRFDSFAPIRYNCNAQWVVDGRNYFWNVAKAIANAKKEIYIHDWWLSAELYMRRPAAHNFKWRLDRLLQRKAKQGVKIFIIMYKEVSITLPLYSHYAKEHLLSLSPNIYVMRHPSHIGIAGRTATFFWAHHEKICVVDNYIAFLGGIDLCFGRWDTPAHVLVDERDAKLDKNVKAPQIWHGKDYSNPRILDFHTLDQPDQDNMDRSKIPRMPWHDISMQVVGQPARDAARHFVQRWNFLRAKKAPKRLTPYLLPKPDFTPSELEKLKFTGTCEVQILRSCSSWSIGYRDRIEHSIHDAYVKSIQESEHFVYIENQFFVTSTIIGTTTIENKIGDALVERILLAAKEGHKWRAIIVIPLVPAFQSNVDEPEGMSIRMIMNCQYRSICRGEHSIYGRLKAENINPDDYITFYSLRNWGRLGGEYVTEQIYIHAKVRVEGGGVRRGEVRSGKARSGEAEKMLNKLILISFCFWQTMIVDDRIAIIGSANINERSQRGSRDSEIAAYVRDSKMIDSRMAGKPYQVGHFAHSLRLRLMNEHLGVDVDAIEVDQINNGDISYFQFGSDDEDDDDGSDNDNEDNDHNKSDETLQDEAIHDIGEERSDRRGDSFDDNKRGANEKLGEDWPKVPQEGDWDEGEAKASNERTAAKQEEMSGEFATGAGKRVGPSRDSDDQHSKDTQSGAPNEHRTDAVRVIPPTEPSFDRSESTPTPSANDQTSAPLSPVTSDASTAAGLVSHLNVDRDNIVTTQADISPQKQRPQDSRQSSDKEKKEKFWKSVQMDDPSTDPLPSLNSDLLIDPIDEDFFIHLWQRTANHNTDCYRRVFLAVPDDNVTTWARYKEFKDMTEIGLMGSHGLSDLNGSEHNAQVAEGGDTQQGEVDPRGKVLIETTGKSDDQIKQQVSRIEDILAEIRGNLVIFPTKFMEAEDERNDFLFNTDRLAPIDVFD
jgi:phospholipase D1/2